MTRSPIELSWTAKKEKNTCQRPDASEQVGQRGEVVVEVDESEVGRSGNNLLANFPIFDDDHQGPTGI